MRVHTNFVSGGLLPRRLRRLPAMTMVEVFIAIALFATVFAVLVPQIRSIQNSWASKRANSEVIQNGCTLMDHLSFTLMQAVTITAVSDPDQADGYIEFEASSGDVVRYQIGANNYVRFGPLGSLADVAGPVSRLQFTCYDAYDLDTPITDVDEIRSVTARTTLNNPAPLGRDLTFTAQSYIRSNAEDAYTVSNGGGPPFEFDKSAGRQPALAKIDAAHYLCAYKGPNGDGWAVVLVVNPFNWMVSKSTPFEYDGQDGGTPALCRIDDEHYLCTYTGLDDVGVAVVLTVNPGTWQISKESPLVFDNGIGKTPCLSKIDDTHYLCAYKGVDADGWAVVLTVDTGNWSISRQTPFEFDTSRGDMPTLAKVDAAHYLCAYQGAGKDGWAAVLTVDTGNWKIARGPRCEFNDIAETHFPALSKVDDRRYLCTYMNTMGGLQGWAIMLTVDTGTWKVTAGPALNSSNGGTTPAAARIDTAHHLCLYAPTGTGFDGWSTVLTINRATGLIADGELFEYDSTRGIYADLCRVDDNHFLCAYEGPGSDGWAIILDAGPAIEP